MDHGGDLSSAYFKLAAGGAVADLMVRTLACHLRLWRCVVKGSTGPQDDNTNTMSRLEATHAPNALSGRMRVRLAVLQATNNHTVVCGSWRIMLMLSRGIAVSTVTSRDSGMFAGIKFVERSGLASCRVQKESKCCR